MRRHKTIKIKGYRAGEGEGIDEMIQGVLKTLAREYGSTALYDVKVYTIETKPLPPCREEFLTVIADCEK